MYIKQLYGIKIKYIHFVLLLLFALLYAQTTLIAYPGFIRLKFMKCSRWSLGYAISPDNKYIYYIKDSNDIYRINNIAYQNSQNLINICHLKDHFFMYNFFAGKNNDTIYFSDDRGQNHIIDTIELANLDISYVCVSGTTDFTNIDVTTSVSLSPDGKDLAITRGSNLVIFNLATKKTNLIAHLPHLELISPSWSPDGKNICFVTISARHSSREWWQIYSANIRSHHYRHLTYTTGALSDEDPVYLDLTHIIFIRRSRGLIGKANLITKSGIDSRWLRVYATALYELDTQTRRVKTILPMTSVDRSNLTIKDSILYMLQDERITIYKIVK